MPGRSYDVAVIGGGPAGALAARELALGGLGVVLCEKARLPRYKACGGGVVARAWRLRPPGMRTVESLDLRHAELWAPRVGLVAVSTRAEPFLHMVMRADFDAALVERAKAVGVELRAGTSLEWLVRRSDRLLLGCSTGALTARFVVAADGTSGPTARLAGWGRQGGTVPAIEAELRVGADVLRSFQGSARFDLRTPLQGYSWVFPKRGHLSLGVLSRAKPAPALKRELFRYMDRLGLPRDGGLDLHGYRIPVQPRREGPAHGRVLLTGDACGLADPLTLEGITHAMRSGQLAARAILDGRQVAGAVERSYRALLGEHVLPDIVAGRRFARLLYARAPLVDQVLRRAGGRIGRRLTSVFAGEDTFRGLMRRTLALTWLMQSRPAG